MKELVPDHQGLVLVMLFVVGNTLVFALGGVAGPDIWLAFLLATVLAIPMILLMARVRSLMGGASLACGLEQLLGKWPSRALAFAYAGYAWRLACYVVSDVTNFIQAVALPTTPQVVTATLFALLMLWAAKEGVEVLARFAVIMSKVVFNVLFVTFLMLLSQVELGEFQPVMYNGVKPVWLGAFQLLEFPFLEVVVLFWVFDCFRSKKSPYRVFLPGFVAASLILLVMASTSLAVVGAERYAQLYFPVWAAVARINISTFLTRLEAIIGVTFAIGSFVKMAACLLAASRSLAYSFGFADYRFLVTPLALGVIPGSQWFISTLLDVELSVIKTYPTSATFFQAVLPVLIWIWVEWRARKLGRGKSSPTQAGGQ